MSRSSRYRSTSSYSSGGLGGGYSGYSSTATPSYPHVSGGDIGPDLGSASSPMVNSSSAYSSYLLRHSATGGSASTKDVKDTDHHSYSSPRRTYRFEEDSKRASNSGPGVSDGLSSSGSYRMRAYKGARSSQQDYFSSSLDSMPTTNWRTRFNQDFESSPVTPRGRSMTRDYTPSSRSRSVTKNEMPYPSGTSAIKDVSFKDPMSSILSSNFKDHHNGDSNFLSSTSNNLLLNHTNYSSSTTRERYLSESDPSYQEILHPEYSSRSRSRERGRSSEKEMSTKDYTSTASSSFFRDRYPSGQETYSDPIRTSIGHSSRAMSKDRSMNYDIPSSSFTPTRDHSLTPRTAPSKSTNLYHDSVLFNGFSNDLTPTAPFMPTSSFSTSLGSTSQPRQSTASTAMNESLSIYNRDQEIYPSTSAYHGKSNPLQSNRNLVRSNSFKDLREFDPDYNFGASVQSPFSGRGSNNKRARHQTLAYGVSAADLGIAKTAGIHELASDWRSFQEQHLPFVHPHQRPSTARSAAGAGASKASVSFKGSSDNPQLRGFSSDMSYPSGQYMIPSSMTIAELEQEARQASSQSAVESSAAGVVGDNRDLVVVRKDDLNSILSTKPTLLIGREINLNEESNKGSSVRKSGEKSPQKSEKSSSSRSSSENAREKNRHNRKDEEPSKDYRKLYEDAQRENSRLRDELNHLKDELGHTRKKLDAAVQNAATGLNDTERREKKAMEKKLTEMEEELKQLEHLKNDNQRLRDENGALIRIISKLSK